MYKPLRGMDSRPGANVENLETCLAGRAQLSPVEPDFWQRFREQVENQVFLLVLYGFKAGWLRKS